MQSSKHWGAFHLPEGALGISARVSGGAPWSRAVSFRVPAHPCSRPFRQEILHAAATVCVGLAIRHDAASLSWSLSCASGSASATRRTTASASASAACLTAVPTQQRLLVPPGERCGGCKVWDLSPGWSLCQSKSSRSGRGLYSTGPETEWLQRGFHGGKRGLLPRALARRSPTRRFSPATHDCRT